ncbi:MAG: hypothetical protein ABJD53_11145 [Gammaproteobacteria bacterium]
MEVSKISPVDAPQPPAGTTAAADQRTQSSATLVPAADQADIRPLDTAGALQILIAEVRAGLQSSLEAASSQSPANAHGPVIAQDSVQAAHELLQMFLREIPQDDGDARMWISTLVRVEGAVQSGMERALGIVTQWRDVPTAVVDVVKETRVLFLSGLGDDPLNPVWLRPEWVSLAPAFHRFRRRRRIARRRLTDPDYSTGSLDDDNEEYCR